MANIYERHAVCSDTTWNALSTTVQDEYDTHYSSWTAWLAATKSDLVTLDSGCREVIIWNDFGELPQFVPTASQIGTNDADNYTIFRAHSTARNNGSVSTGLKMAGARHNYQLNYVLFDGFIFDEDTDGTSGDQYYLLFTERWAAFENCVFANIYYCFYNLLTTAYFKNCIFYNWNVYFRATASGTTFYNCGFYNTFNHQYNYAFRSGEFYNCWAYDTDDLSDGIFGTLCTGNNNYASDGSGPIAERTLATFGFTDAANGDFSLTSSSPLFNTGIATEDELTVDIAGNPRISGSSLDIGPFEKTVQTQVTLSGVIVGSAISIVDLDNGGYIVSPFAADDTSETMEFSLSTSTNVSIRVRNASGTTKYIPWKSDFLLTTAGATLYVTQLEDTIATS